MTINAALKALSSAETQELFNSLYGNGQVIFEEQKKRYSDLIVQFRNRFSDMDIQVFSSPGRSEICGNHTDHNHGRVLAASIQLDCIAVVAPSTDGHIYICDSAYNEDYRMNIDDAHSQISKKGSPALIGGIVEGFRKAGYKVGGFYGCFASDVIPASGVSSSAAFEMLICQIINEIYNGGAVPVEKCASIGQYAENEWWGKASGLLDQMACGIGGLVTIDFKNPASPLVEKIPFDFAAQGYRLILVSTGGNHAELSGEYSAIPNEMKQVARCFNKDTLRDVSANDIFKNLNELRLQCGDRAIMRTFHFIQENERVEAEITALKANDFFTFLRHINDSGNSSWKWLQNVYVSSDCARSQSVSVSLALTEIFISRNGLTGKAACRIHGGGFAGVIQVFLPNEYVDEYKRWMFDALQVTDDPVFTMSIRPYGAIKVI
jgi:galactokinase